MRGKVVALHINNQISYHYVEDIEKLLSDERVTRLNILGETTTQDYMVNEKSFQKRMEDKLTKLKSIDQEEIEDIR